MNASGVLLVSTLALLAATFLIIWRLYQVRPALFWGLGFACWSACYLLRPFADAVHGLWPAMLSQSLFLASIFLQMHGLQDRAGESRFALRTRIAICLFTMAFTWWLLAQPELKWAVYSSRLAMRLLLTGFAVFAMWRHMDQLIDAILLAAVVLMTLAISVLAAWIIHSSWASIGAPRSPGLTAASQIVGNVTSIAFGMTLLAAIGADMMRRYRDASLRDALTGLPNRRQFDASLEAQWRAAAARARPLSLLLIDVDMFKAYNDSHGHAAGDRCLVEIAKLIQADLREADGLCARLGGEEFAVLLPRTLPRDAHVVAERLREVVQAAGMPLAASPFGVVTVSIGVATIVPATEIDAALFEAADEALYRAKHRGRNRVEGSTTVPPATTPSSELAEHLGG